MMFLDEVLRIAKEKLSEEEWLLINAATNELASDPPPALGNRLRVRLHRIRKKLAKALGGVEK